MKAHSWIRAAGAAALIASSVGVPAARATPTPGVTPSYCLRDDGGYRCMIGPFDVDAGERIEMMTGVAAPSEAGYMTSAKARLVDGRGKAISHHAVHLHHAVWLNPYEDDMTCDSYDGGFPDYERFFATGKELTRVKLPKGYGYHWDPQVSQPFTQSAPWWALVVHLDGMHGASDVWIEVNMGFVPDSEAAGMVAVEPVWLDVRNCSSEPVYTVDNGSGKGGVHKERWTYTMPRGGRFVFLGGHLHDGGLRIGLDNATTGEHIYTSRARYGVEDETRFLTAMTTWSGGAGIAVSKGDRLRLTAVYDSTRTWKDVMGIMVGTLAPASAGPTKTDSQVLRFE